jgi:hypothetical protein
VTDDRLSWGVVLAREVGGLGAEAGQGVGALAAERSAADVVADFASAADLLRKAAR